MGKLRNLALAGLITLGSLGLFNQGNAQTKKIKVVDTILYGIDSLKSKAGLANKKVKWNSLEFKTNSEGYIDFTTSVNDNKEKQNESFLRIIKQDNKLSFNFDGESSLKIYDILGREIFSKDNAYNNITWNLENLPNGFYVYEVRGKDKIERGALIANFSNGKSNIYLKGNYSKSGRTNRKEGVGNVVSNLEKIVDGINLTIRDEDIPSTDSINNLGNYFDVEASYSSLDSIPEVIHMIPVLQFDSKEYRNILHFIKYMTYSDGTNGVNILLRWYKKDQPIKFFRNATTAPNQNYIAAFDSATSQSATNSWETMTSFNYKDISLPKINLFQEVNVNPDTGATMDYSSNLSHVIDLYYGPTAGLARGPPYFSRVYVDNTRGNTNLYWYRISGETKHEIGHVLFSSARHSLDINHNIYSGAPPHISLDEGKTVRIIYSLKDLQDMSIYKED